MNQGFVRVAASTPHSKVADCSYNRESICQKIEEAAQYHVKVLVMPELCITGYTCGDLFLQNILLDAAKEELLNICEYTKGKDMVVFAGLPFAVQDCLYNAAAVLYEGEILGLVPKEHIPNYSEFYEARYFAAGPKKPIWITVKGRKVPFGTDILFRASNLDGLTLAAEVCEDVWVPCPPDIRHALHGATLLANLSASNETTGKSGYRTDLIRGQSARLICGYVYAGAGDGESTTDLVFAAPNMIAESGKILAESVRFQNQTAIADIDLERLQNERRKMSTFAAACEDNHLIIPFAFSSLKEEKVLFRTINPMPFVPSGQTKRNQRCEEVLMIQVAGLKKRLEHTSCKHAIIGISGGLDSTLALLVTVRAFDILGIARENIIAVTMPCFGTTDRTYQNAVSLTNRLGASLKEINIKESVLLHFRDIGHNSEIHDTTYENAQARERTQILMDIANQQNGMVIGTGDMSELALGWATYNGDHMSMYGVNASVPKTLVRHLVAYCADNCEEELKIVLKDILDTPVSPELLPPKDGEISQKTEDIVGPYELHDFYLYYVLRFGYTPKKIYRLALQAFEGIYSAEVMKKWLAVFYKRFFSQQFKRSCLPDGPKVGSVALSPRGDLRMPSDACVRLWIEEVECLP